MSFPARNKSQKKASGSRVVALVVLVLIVGAVFGYYFIPSSTHTGMSPQESGISPVIPVIPSSPGRSPLPDVPQPLRKDQSAYPDTVKTPEIENTGSGVRLAVIIDDMGSSLSEAASLAAIKVPLTFAIIPGLPADMAVAAYAASQKIESIIHIPMQAKGWPARRLEENGLLVSMDSDELQDRASRFVQRFPGAVGANNHMGSEFTEHEEKMGAVLQILKKADLFFVDSVTSPKSAGVRVSQQLGIKTARRNVFLDNEQERSYILGQLSQAVRMARKNGSAIVIGHPHSVTISTLAAALPELARQGVKLVPLSQLVK